MATLNATPETLYSRRKNLARASLSDASTGEDTAAAGLTSTTTTATTTANINKQRRRGRSLRTNILLRRGRGGGESSSDTGSSSSVVPEGTGGNGGFGGFSTGRSGTGGGGGGGVSGPAAAAAGNEDDDGEDEDEDEDEGEDEDGGGSAYRGGGANGRRGGARGRSASFAMIILREEIESAADTAYWGWVLLPSTWTVFVVGMGSMLGIWEWAWDVPGSLYPKVIDEEEVFRDGYIPGYYPAMIILTCVMAWVWVVVAWMGMKYFKHAKIQPSADDI